MSSRLGTIARRAPVTVPALAAVLLFLAWATSEAGYPVTHWAPGGLLLIGLLVVAAITIGANHRVVPLAVKVSLGCLAAYTALSYLSITWAQVPGDAWDGANRTLLYLLVFTLFAYWPQRPASAAVVLIVWVLGVTAIGVWVAIHLQAASMQSLQTLMPEARLVYPSDYANANAAQWLMAFWPALLLSRSAQLPAALRGLLAGAAVMLASLALLSLSRGALYATPVMLVLVFALIPGRIRTFAALAPVAAGVAAAAPAVLRVGNHLAAGRVVPHNVHGAVTAIFAASVVVGAAVGLVARLDSGRVPSPSARLMVRRAIVALATTTLAVLVIGGLIAAGDPLTRAEHAWDTFKSPQAYAANVTGNRLVGGLGSQRYDVYRVALDEFVAHPLVGIGADNFAEQYLAHGRSEVTPRYPHSVEIRALVETGLVGLVLAVVGLAAALVACARTIRAEDPLTRAVSAAALAGFGYWFVHGSFDWFWEFAGLGAPAFALLGMTCALGPGYGSIPDPEGGRRPIRRLGAAVLAGAAVAGAGSLIAPWLSQLEIESAASAWTRSSSSAYSRLHEAAQLNPLSDEAYVVAGSIALRRGELSRADGYFKNALSRTPGDAYATLERGAIASAQRRRSGAETLLSEAVHLDPRSPLAKEALHLVHQDRRISIGALDAAILRNAQQLR